MAKKASIASLKALLRSKYTSQEKSLQKALRVDPWKKSPAAMMKTTETKKATLTCCTTKIMKTCIITLQRRSNITTAILAVTEISLHLNLRMASILEIYQASKVLSNKRCEELSSIESFSPASSTAYIVR